MDQQQVDARQAQPLQAVLERAHHAIIAVVEPHTERQPAGPHAAIEGFGVVAPRAWCGRPWWTARIAARLAIQRAAEAVLALRQAVPGRGVVVADAGVPGGLQCGSGLRFGDDLEQVAEPGAAEAELRDLDLGPAEPAAGERIHSAGYPVIPARRVQYSQARRGPPGLPHLGDFPIAEIDDVAAHSHRLGLDLRIDLQVNGCVHRVLDRYPGDSRTVASHQHDAVRSEPLGKIVSLRGRRHQKVGVAEPVANVPDAESRSDPRRDVKERSQLHVLRNGKGDHLVRVVMHHGHHIGTLAVDRAMYWPFGILRTPAQVDRIAVQIVFDDVVECHRVPDCAMPDRKNRSAPLRMAHADMTVGIDYTFMRKDAVGDDEVSQDVGSTHCGAPVGVGRGCPGFWPSGFSDREPFWPGSWMDAYNGRRTDGAPNAVERGLAGRPP